MIEKAQAQMPAVVDIVLGAAAITVPLWLQWLHEGAQIFIAVGGAILIVYRFYRIGVKWYRKGKQ